jgi:predicted nucleic acid-binding protein
MKLEATMPNGVLLDTSFLLRFLDEKSPLFANADNYYRYFLEKNFDMFISTITIGEYCVGGSVDELPLKNLKILPLNFEHAVKAGEFGRILYKYRGIGKLEASNRIIIINDAKLFSQADVEENISFYATSDKKSIKLYSTIKNDVTPNFEIIDINTPHTELFGLLGL